MAKVILKDGTIREVADGTSLLDLAKELSNSLAKKVLVGKVDDKIQDLTYKLSGEHNVELLTFDDADGKRALRHTASHVMAQAIKRLYKDEKVQLAIGPSIENGFYYDIDMERRVKTHSRCSAKKAKAIRFS